MTAFKLKKDKKRRLHNINLMSKSFRLQAMLLTVSILLAPLISAAQIAFKFGGNYSTIRNDIPLKNIKPILVSDIGASFHYHPFKGIRKWSLINELSFSQKGYQQDSYIFRFDYCAFPVMVCYEPVKNFSMNAGIEPSALISTNIKQGMSTYHHFDTGLLLGFNVQKSKIVSFYMRGVYGLMPLLDYYRFDEIGNFTGRIHDLKNISLSFGIKINIFNEKFKPYS